MKPLGFSFFQATYSTPNMVDAGIAAEKHGFGTVMIGDHFLDLSGLVKVDPWVVLAYIGARTSKIRLATYVTDVLRTHPSKVAHLAATLDELSGGRATIGLGAGESMNLVPFGLDFPDPESRVARLREGMQVIRLLLSSTKEAKADFDGRFFRLSGAWLQQRPVQEHIPIGVGALGSSRTLRLIGEMGDIWFPAYGTPALFKERVSTIREAAVASRRDPDTIDYSAAILAVLSRDKDTVKKAVDAYRGSILSLAPRQVKRLGLPKRANVDLRYDYQRVIPGDPVLERMADTIRQIPDELVEDFLVIGSPEDLVEAVARYQKAGATSVLVWDMVAEGLKDSLQLGVENMKKIQQRVMPHFRN